MKEIPGVFLASGLPGSSDSLGLQGDMSPWFLRGAIAQVIGTHGSGKTETVLRSLSKDQRVIWVEDEFTLYPTALPQYGLGLERVVFIDFSRVYDFGQILRIVQQIVSSRAFDVCILSLHWERHLSPEEMSTALRRVQLAAEKSQTMVILISEKAAPSGASWPIAVQMRVTRDSEGKPMFEIFKQKRGIYRV